MSDEFDDDVNLDDTFDDFEEKKSSGTLGDMWRDNPVFKIGVIVGAVIIIFIVINFISGDGEAPIDQSYVGAAPSVSSAPGTDKASPAYIQAIEEQNEADVEQAQATGGSALPVPIEPPVGLISVPEESEEAEDPLQRWRRLQEERLQREIQQRETIAAADVAGDQARADSIDELAGLMSEQMSSILGTKSETGISTLNVTDPDFLEYLRQQEEGEDGDVNSTTSSEEDEFEEEIIQEILLPAGEIVYAQLLTEANSDSPGPVLAEILSGPFRGSRILGSFEVQEQGDVLTINFDTLVIDEESISVDAVALDPETTLPGMATEVDHRYLQRVILPAAAAFVEGFANAVSETGSTTITINNSTDTTNVDEEDPDTDQEIASGVTEVGTELREILDEMADEIETLIRIEAGTPIAILFTEPVETGDEEI